MDLKTDQRKVRELRLGLSWSQEELAERAGVSLRTVQRMETDGSASLKSRRAVADALGVDPTCLNSHQAGQTAKGETRENSRSPIQEKSSWRKLFGYPGPATVSSRIRTPLLVTLWLGTVITGGLIVLTTVGLTIAGFLKPGISFELILTTQIPIFVSCAIFLGLYGFFRRLSAPPPE